MKNKIILAVLKEAFYIKSSVLSPDEIIKSAIDKLDEVEDLLQTSDEEILKDIHAKHVRSLSTQLRHELALLEIEDLTRVEEEKE